MVTIDLSVRDAMSAGVDAATASLNKLADAGDKATSSTANLGQSTSKVGPSFDTLNKKIDDNAYLTSQMVNINTRYAQQSATLNSALNSGSISLDQYNQKISNIGVLRDADIAKAQKQGKAIADQFSGVPPAANEASNASAGFTRELIVMGHEIVTGNFSRLGGSMLVLTERSETLTGIVQNMGKFLLGWPGVFLAAGAALVEFGIQAQNEQAQLIALQTQLQGTRDDYVAMAAQATAAARAIAATKGLGVNLTDATAASDAIAAQPNWSGTQTQTQNLITLFSNLHTVTGLTFDDLAKGIDNAGALAQEFADKHLLGVTQALADTVKGLDNAGKQTEAFGLLMDTVGQKVNHATENSLTPYKQALNDLNAEMTKTSKNGESFNDMLNATTVGLVNFLQLQVRGFVNLVTDLEDLYNKIKGLHLPSLGNAPTQVFPGGTSRPDPLEGLKIIPGQMATETVGGPVIPFTQSGIALTGALDDYTKQIIADKVTAGQLNQAQADFASKIALAESGGQQFNPDGSVVQGPITKNGQRAQGMFQLMSGTADALGVDASTEAGNVQGGLAYINQLWTKYHGDPTLVAMAYNWGPGNVDQFLAGTKALTDVPNETQNFVAKTTGSQIAVDASGHYQSQVYTGGVVVDPKTQVDNALKDAEKAGGAGFDYDKAAQDVHKYTDALQVLATEGDTSSSKVVKLQQALAKAEEAMYNAVGPLQSLYRQQEQTVQSNEDMAAAYGKGQDAVLQATAAESARATLLSNHITPATANYIELLKNQTAEQLKIAASSTDASVAKTIEQTDAATAAQLRINAAYDGTALSLSNAQNYAKAYAQVNATEASTTDGFTDKVNALAASFDRATAANLQLQQQQASVSALSGAFSSAFSTIGDAITQAFVQGQGAAVNWGNVIKSVIAQVIQKVAELAVLNPILNSLFGQNNGTLGTALSVLSASGGSSSGGGSGAFGNLFSLASTGNSVSGALGGPSLSSYLGLTAPGGTLTSVGGLLYPGMDAAAALPTAYGPVASVAETTPGLLGGPILGAGLGSWAGGIGGGFAVGSMVGGLVQGGLNKTGPAPTIGAGIGAVGGAIAGTLILPGVGTVIGGLLGGALGGAGGGLIGPHVASPYSSTLLSTVNGQLSVGNTLSQKYDPTNDVANLNAEVAQLNAALAANNLSISNRNIQIGTNTPGGYQDPTKFGSLDAAIGGYSFSSATDQNLNDKIGQQSFASVQAVIDWINKYNAAQAASTSFISSTTSTISSLNKTTGSLNDQIADITNGYNAVIDAGNQIIATNDLSTTQVNSMVDAENKLSAARDAAIKAASDAAAAQDAATQSGLESRYLQAQNTISGNINDTQAEKLYTFDQSAQQQRDQYKQSLIALYGDTITTTEGYAADMALLEKTLGEERLEIVKQYNDQIASQFGQIVSFDSNLSVRYNSAQAAISGDPAQVENANLYSFDVNAQSQRDAFSKQLTDLYGDSFKTTSDYAAQMAGLEKTLGEERLQIVTQYNQQISQAQEQASGAAASMLQSISQFVTNLQGSDSPLSPQAQLALQESTFDKDNAASGAGDFNATGRLTSDASNLLNASKAYYGTGAGYVADYQKVLDALTTVSMTPPDTLTASAFASETQTQTATLVDSLADLKTQLVAIKLQLQQGSAQPKQLA